MKLLRLYRREIFGYPMRYIPSLKLSISAKGYLSKSLLDTEVINSLLKGNYETNQDI